MSSAYKKPTFAGEYARSLPRKSSLARWARMVGFIAAGFAGLRPAGYGQAASPAPQGPITHNTTVLVGADRRASVSLDGPWHVIPDPYYTGGYTPGKTPGKHGWWEDRPQPQEAGPGPVEYNFAKSKTIMVPGDWNSQWDQLFYYEGLVWYERTFEHPAKSGARSFLHFGAINYRSAVWVNGQLVCEHEGGFTSFDCEVTKALKDGNNDVVIGADDTRIADGVPTLKTDWWNYGGITRDVFLVDVPEAFIDDYDVHLSRADHNVIEGSVHVEEAAPGSQITIALPQLRAHGTAAVGPDGRAAFRLPVSGLQPWTPDSPKLYRLVLTAGADSIDEELGFKTIEVRGTDILLNGKPIFLRGVSIHAEAPYRSGRANTDKDAETLLTWVKELNGNYARLAHYPHDERMTRAADRMGILIWSEIPVYWGIQWSSPQVLARAQQQLREEIRRDRNKVSVGLWSVANETQIGEARNKFLGSLVDTAHELDPTRPVTAALLVRTDKAADHPAKIVDDPLGRALDVIGTNEYIGWYEATPETADVTTWDIRFQKPLVMSEFGADAVAGLHGDITQRWTEEYQANVYRHQLPMLDKIPQLRGMSPWVLMDFRSPLRNLAGVQDLYNRKGLVSDKGVKKLAFSVLGSAYKTKARNVPH